VPWRTVPAFIIGVLAALAAALVVLCRGPARADSPVTGQIVRWWAAVLLRAPGARVVVRHPGHVRPRTVYVVVSNHQSNPDSMVHLRVLPPGLRVLARREMFRIWLPGPAMRAIGMIQVDRDGDTAGLRRHLNRFEALTSAVWTARHAVCARHRRPATVRAHSQPVIGQGQVIAGRSLRGA
jgi:1-acyl-sn-glycerol-3-phosphate acyltransferase